MKNLAIIPARGGSKRIPRKNIKDFLGKPIIAYSIETAIESGLFEEIMVSTDDHEIAEIAIKCGAKVPFFRSEKTANDFAHIAEVIEEVLETYKSENKQFENFCCIFSTAPFIKKSRLKDGFELMLKNNFDSVFPVLKFSYPIQRALKIENEKVSMILPENFSKRSQDLMPTYHDSGQFYWMKTKEFYRQKRVFAENSGAIILSDMEVQDIDTIEDWEVAEMKYRLLNKIL
ncbi:MAG: pseudaminic acid cytidylyltransferase [Bacteroidetes bacterium GWA2_30_7]|nr:MAG: pseudaminic acid cytidylyltransferase [Bacteroidetes bacterium GWA2_30_7]